MSIKIRKPFNWKLLNTHDDVNQMITDFGRHQLLGIDFETTGLDYVRDDVHGMGIANPDQAWYIPKSLLPHVMPWLQDLMRRKDVFTIAHNLKFDLHFLQQVMGNKQIIIANPVDTMIAQWLINENEALKLNSLAQRRLGYTSEELPTFKDLLKQTKIDKGVKRLDQVNIYDIDPLALAKHGAIDPWLCVQMWPMLRYELVQEEQEQQFFDIEMPFMQILQRMEQAGIYLHCDKLLALQNDWQKQKDILLTQWNEITKNDKYVDGRNPNSNPQIREWFYEILDMPINFYTKSGAPSTKALAILRMVQRDTTGTAKLLQKHRKVAKLLSTYVDPFLEKAHNGYLHGYYSQTGTVSGRLASHGPNLQNIPIRGELGSQLRMTMGGPPGYDYLMADYNQVELRIAAHYGDVRLLKEVFANNGDPHQQTADLVSVSRYIAKTLNFAWLYGAGIRKFCDEVEENGFPRPLESDAKKWFSTFNNSYPELTQLKKRVILVGQQRGYIKTLMNRRRRIPEINAKDNSTRYRAERQFINSLIQGGAADIIKWAMLVIDKELPKYGAYMISQSHDELGILAPHETIKETSLIVKQIMENAGEHFGLSVPLIADPVYANTWGEAKEK